MARNFFWRVYLTPVHFSLKLALDIFYSSPPRKSWHERWPITINIKWIPPCVLCAWLPFILWQLGGKTINVLIALFYSIILPYTMLHWIMDILTMLALFKKSKTCPSFHQMVKSGNLGLVKILSALLGNWKAELKHTCMYYSLIV